MAYQKRSIIFLVVVIFVAVIYFLFYGQRQAGETSAVIDAVTPFHFQATVTSIDNAKKLYFVSGFDNDFLLKNKEITRRDAVIQVVDDTQFSKLESTDESDGRGGKKLIIKPAAFSDVHIGDYIMVKAAETYRNTRVIKAGVINILPPF